MHRKLPIWSILLVLSIFFIGFSFVTIASKQNNINFDITTIHGNAATLSPITLTTTVRDRGFTYDSWDISYNFATKQVEKSFHDGLYKTEDSNFYPPVLRIDSSMDEFYDTLSSGHYMAKDYFPTVPLVLSSDSGIPQLKDNFPYLTITTPSDWYIDIEKDGFSTSISQNFGSYIELELITINDRTFFTLPTLAIEQISNDIERNPLEYTGTSGIFEMSTSFKPSESVTYEQLIHNILPITIFNNSTTEILKLIPLEEQNSLGLLTLENKQDFRIQIYNLSKGKVVADKLLCSSAEKINFSDLWNFSSKVIGNTVLVSYNSSTQLASDEKVNELYNAATAYDEENEQLYDDFLQKNKDRYIEEYGSTEYEDYFQKDFYNIMRPNPFWEQYSNAFYDDFSFFTFTLDDTQNVTLLQNISFHNLSKQGIEIETLPTTLIDCVYEDSFTYLLMGTLSGYNPDAKDALSLIVLEDDSIKYIGQIDSDVSEDFSKGYVSELYDFGAAYREYSTASLQLNSH